MSDGFFVAIPARFESSRLPGKPLADLGGKPMIVRVYESAVRSNATEVLVATDDQRIARACREAGAPVELTARQHESGTDRIAEVAERRGWSEDDIVVNVQGDEPLLPPALINQVASVLRDDRSAAVATLVTAIRSAKDWSDPNSVRVVVNRDGHALYFSRAQIPSPRDGGIPAAHRHIGLYAYRIAALRELAATPPCDLERIEKLEQLRALWLGMKIAVAEAVEEPPPGVDTEEDLETVRAMFVNS